MKRLVMTGVIFASLALAACGGGGSSNGGPIPNPGPSNNPPISYAAKLVYVGPLSRSVQADLREAQSLAPMTSGTPIPVMLVSPITDGCIGSSCYGTSAQGQVEAVVSPAPSVQPSVAFTQNDSHAALIPTPTASASPASGIVGVVGLGDDGTNNVQASGSASAAIGSPVDQNPTTMIYQYAGLAVDCNPTKSFTGNWQGWQGWQYTASGWVMTNDPTVADVYVTGSTCGTFGGSTAYQVAGDNGTLHFPGGGTLISNDTVYAAVTASQWANTQTTASIATLAQPNADGSFNALLIAKTRDGAHTFKMTPTSLGNSAGNGNYEGPVEVAGASIDGF